MFCQRQNHLIKPSPDVKCGVAPLESGGNSVCNYHSTNCGMPAFNQISVAFHTTGHHLTTATCRGLDHTFFASRRVAASRRWHIPCRGFGLCHRLLIFWPLGGSEGARVSISLWRGGSGATRTVVTKWWYWRSPAMLSYNSDCDLWIFRIYVYGYGSIWDIMGDNNNQYVIRKAMVNDGKSIAISYTYVHWPASNDQRMGDPDW